MKKLFLFLLTFSLVLVLAGCGTTKADSGSTPEWLNEMPPEGVIWGIGIAKQSSPTMSRTTAEARARTGITRQLDSLVQAMFTDYNLDAGNVRNQANTSLQEDVSRQISNLRLSGARPIKQWQANDGTWWFLVEYNKANARRDVASILNNDEAAFAQFKTQQALQIMDSHLSKTQKPLQVSE